MNSSPWSLESIASGNSAFDSKRIIYRSNKPLSEANLEFFCTGTEISGYFSSPGRRFGTGASASARLSIGSECLEEELPLHEGRMRVKLPEEWTFKTVDALKNGQEVGIMVGSIEQIIQPDQLLKQL